MSKTENPTSGGLAMQKQMRMQNCSNLRISWINEKNISTFTVGFEMLSRFMLA